MAAQVSCMKVSTPSAPQSLWLQRKPKPASVTATATLADRMYFHSSSWQLSCCVASWEKHHLLPRMSFRSALLQVSQSEHSCHGQGPGYSAFKKHCLGRFHQNWCAKSPSSSCQIPSHQCLAEKPLFHSLMDPLLTQPVLEVRRDGAPSAPATPALGRLRQEEPYEFGANLGYTVRPSPMSQLPQLHMGTNTSNRHGLF